MTYTNTGVDWRRRPWCSAPTRTWGPVWGGKGEAPVSVPSPPIHPCDGGARGSLVVVGGTLAHTRTSGSVCGVRNDRLVSPVGSHGGSVKRSSGPGVFDGRQGALGLVRGPRCVVYVLSYWFATGRALLCPRVPLGWVGVSVVGSVARRLTGGTSDSRGPRDRDLSVVRNQFILLCRYGAWGGFPGRWCTST